MAEHTVQQSARRGGTPERREETLTLEHGDVSCQEAADDQSIDEICELKRACHWITCDDISKYKRGYFYLIPRGSNYKLDYILYCI